MAQKSSNKNIIKLPSAWSGEVRFESFEVRLQAPVDLDVPGTGEGSRDSVL